MKKFYIATDHAGFEVKDFVIEYVRAKGHEIIDLGPFNSERVDYPDFAKKCADAVVQDNGSFGILICGAANKVAGVRAALCHDAYTAGITRNHNDANILCFGSRVVGLGVIESMIDAFIANEFEGGRHGERVAKIEGCAFGANL